MKTTSNRSPVREIAAYLSLTYGVALAIALALPDANINKLLSIFAPTVAVTILTFTHVREGRAALAVGRSRPAPRRLRTWPAALLLPVLLCGGAYGTALLIGAGDWTGADLSIAAVPDWIINLVVSLAIMTVVILGEEIGWRGFMLPRVQELTDKKRAAVLTGFAHGLFHLPLICIASTYDTGGSRWIAAPAAVVTITAGGVFYAWLRDRSGSIWPVAIAHNSVNTVFDIGATLVVASSPASLTYVAGETGFATLGACVVMAGVMLKRAEGLASAADPARGYGDRMGTVASLTRAEAEQRAALLEVTRYDVAVDLRGLLEGEVLEAVSTITFTCREPGAADVRRLCRRRPLRHPQRGRLDPATARDGRLPLPDLRAENVLVVASSQSDTASARGIQRTVDPSDKLVYVWTSFECDFARMAWANFDQPDLKAVHGFVVSAPDTWSVLSNSASTAVEALDDGGRLWTFADTPPLSTYVVVVNAGPFYEVRTRRGGHDLGLYCRQSLKHLLDRDADELFEPDRAGAGVVRRALRGAVRAGALRPRLRAEPRRRDGELGVRHLRRLGAAPRHADLRRAPRDRRGGAPRDGAHVVRRPGHDAVVGRPVAQRGLRLVGGVLGGRGRHPTYADGWATFLARPSSRLPPRHGSGQAPDPRATSPTWRRRWRTSTPSPTPRVRPCSNSSARTPARTPSSTACAPTSATTPGATPPSGPDRGDRRRQRAGPRRVGGGVARQRRHRHARARRRHADGRRLGRRGVAAAPPRHRLLRRDRRRPPTRGDGRRGHRGSGHEGGAAGCDLRLVNDHDLTFAAARTDQRRWS